MTLITVVVALGSNIGDREAHLAFAVARLSALLSNLKRSRWYDTAPVDVPGDQPRYLNGVVVGDTMLSPSALLGELLAIEREAGRTRPSPMAPRTLDLDLILYGSERIEEAGLTVPHPRFRERLFVLEPLAEVAPGLVDPGTGETISDLLRRARASS
ncbi:MAG TPA: 2-amino-4-hydroxy-6-hydroxymethyldihydropteridine diphosphokinase [Vicinamibacterales bacterium]